MTTRRLASWLAPLLLLAAGVRAEAPLEESEVKAAFVLNFLKFVEWPAGAFDSPEARLVVGVIGEGPAAEATVALLANKSVGPHPIDVRRIQREEPLAGLHAIFLGGVPAPRVTRVLKAADEEAVLLIGEGENFVPEGGMIGLFVERQKVRFDINPDVAADRGLKISSRLLALARTIYFRHGSNITQR